MCVCVFVDPQCSVFVFLSACRGRQTQPQRWCDTCQTRYTGNVIVHRRTKRHKVRELGRRSSLESSSLPPLVVCLCVTQVCKQRGRPFCPVCKRHFRTPRKFVEHMKSAEHKQQVSRGDSHKTITSTHKADAQIDAKIIRTTAEPLHYHKEVCKPHNRQHNVI